MALLGRMFSSDAHSYWPGWKISHLDVQILADFFCLPPFEILKSSNWQSQTSEVSSSTHKGRVMCSGQKNTMWTPKLPGCGFQQKWLHTGTFKSWTCKTHTQKSNDQLTPKLNGLDTLTSEAALRQNLQRCSWALWAWATVREVTQILT